MAPKVVHVKSGWIRQGHVARGECPSASAQGALDAATHHNWSGKFSRARGGYLVASILGERDNGGLTWKLFTNNLGATGVACKVALHPGEQLLFAAVSSRRPEYPLAVIVPSHAVVGHTFTGKVVYYGSSGHPHPLAGATVSVNGHSGATGPSGTVPLTPSQAGTFEFRATAPGYIRAAPATVTVTG
jgi:hypothetical protein